MTRTSTPTLWNGIKASCALLFLGFETIRRTINIRRIYVDSRLHHYLDLRMNVDFWTRGDFPAVVQNGSEAIILENPWVNGTKAAPFDQCDCSVLINEIIR